MAKGTEIWVCPQCGFRMDIAPLGLYAEVQCPRCFRTERVHAQLGNFRLDAVLGIGGMSVVYRAFDVVLHRALALKVLNDTFRDQPERIERFENESAMMARVRHENVTSVYSAGRAYGQFYIAMELVEGVNLEYMVTAKKTMPAKQALDIIRQVASGLQAANEAGLLHRDMKPGNVLITPEGRAKVIDFGLAMDSREDDTEEIIWATPYYVPPETLQRKPEDVRTDIYALGMTLRFLLTGVERFNGDVSSLNALIQRKRKLVPLAKERPDIAPSLAELVDHMTAFAAVDRPASYSELIEEIDEVSTELDHAIEPTTNGKRHRSVLIKGGILAGCFVAGASVGLHFAPEMGSQLKQEYLALPDESKELQNNAELTKALQYIKAKNYATAVHTLLQASSSTKDPCMGAWYAQLARILLGSCRDEISEAQLAHQLLLRHLANEHNVSSSGRKGLHMISMMDSRPYPCQQDWIRRTGDWNSISKNDIKRGIDDITESDAHPIIKAMELYILSEKAIWQGFPSLSEYCLSKVKSLPSLGEYQMFSELLSTPSNRKKSGDSMGARSQAEALMSSHNFAAAKEHLAALLSDNRSDAQTKTQAKVLHEVCDVAQAMFDVLSRKGRPTSGSDEEILRAARGLQLRPPSRPAASADSSENNRPPQLAIDGNPSTRWCAANARSGHTFALDITSTDNVGYILIQWEQAQACEIIAKLYSEGKVYTQTFTKNKPTTKLAVGNKPLERIELTVNGTSLNNYASIAEIKLVDDKGKNIGLATKAGNDDFADQLRVVLLIAAGKCEEAFNMLNYVVARQGLREPFCVIAEDWKRRWYGKAAQ